MAAPAVLVAGTTIDEQDFVFSRGDGNLLLLVLRSRWSSRCSEGFL